MCQCCHCRERLRGELVACFLETRCPAEEDADCGLEVHLGPGEIEWWVHAGDTGYLPALGAWLPDEREC